MKEQKITPCLWFNDNAGEAMKFYTSVFKDSKAGRVSYYGEGAPLPKGTVLTASFELNGQEFMTLNGGPHFTFSPAVSFVINCRTQDEIDDYWEKLSADPAREQCGWLQDKFGVSWQVVPAILDELMSSQDQEKSARVMQALLQMKKLVIADLIKAFEKDEHQRLPDLQR
jgi:predicted 3-demethylubiquinone-9 3-methyltransferase (glyoxalase superfamily)